MNDKYEVMLKVDSLFIFTYSLALFENPAKLGLIPCNFS